MTIRTIHNIQIFRESAPISSYPGKFVCTIIITLLDAKGFNVDWPGGEPRLRTTWVDGPTYRKMLKRLLAITGLKFRDLLIKRQWCPASIETSEYDGVYQPAVYLLASRYGPSNDNPQKWCYSRIHERPFGRYVVPEFTNHDSLADVITTIKDEGYGKWKMLVRNIGSNITTEYQYTTSDADTVVAIMKHGDSQ